jgi:hypothetical protein
MARFLIEVDHDPEVTACARAASVFLATGSHYLTHAEWGCLDGVHTAWLIVEVDTRAQARAIVPPVHRAGARIVALNRWSIDELDRFLDHHPARAAVER